MGKMLERLFENKRKIPIEVKKEITFLYKLGVEIYELEYLMSVKMNYRD